MPMKRPDATELFHALQRGGAFPGLIRRALQPALPKGSRVVSVRVHRERRLGFKVALRFRVAVRAATGVVRTMFVRGSIPPPDRAPEVTTASQALRALQRQGFSNQLFRVPQPLPTLPATRLFLYREVPGRSFREVLERRGAPRSELFTRAGQLLWRIHALRLQTGRRRTLAAVQREATYFYDDFRRYAPGLVTRVTPLIDQVVRLQERYWAAGQRQARLIHGDYKPGNIIIRCQTTTAIDLGNSVVADPLSDVGNFLAQARSLGWRLGWGARLIDRSLRAFLAGYWQQRRPTPAERQRLAAHQAWWQLQLLAYGVSIKTLLTRRRIAPSALAAIEGRLSELRVNPRPWEQPGVAFERFLRDRGAAATFFRTHIAAFFPGAEELLGLKAEFPEAFSRDSLLSRFRLLIRMRNGSRLARTARGNRVSPSDAQILRRLFGRPGVLVPRVLWYGPAARYLFYEELPGRSFRDVPFRLRTLVPLVRAIGSTLAAIHRVSSRGIRPLRLVDERRELQRMARSFRRTHHPLETNLVKLTHRLDRWLASAWTKLPPVIAHNDFQGSNILVTPRGEIGLIDFSRGGRGPLPIDAAQFVAHLNVMLAPALAPHQRLRLRTAFLQSYLAGLPHAWRAALRRSLTMFELRTALDIVAISCDHLPARLRDRVLKPLYDDLPRLSQP